MLTLFALPKAFHGHFAVIQRNAIASWRHLRPEPEIILFGDDEGTAQAAWEFGVRHIPTVRRNEYGTPLLNDLFEKAQGLASYPILCYANADILLLNDFMEAVKRLASWRDRFLMVGRRTNLDLDHLQDFDSAECEARLHHLALEKGIVGPVGAIDYFVFSRGLYRSAPDLAVGRAKWDNWLIWSARASKAPVVDASAVVSAIHQNHDYSHHPEGWAWLTSGEEAMKNQKLVPPKRAYILDDATHKLTARGIKWDPSRVVLRWVFKTTAPIRRPLGLHRSTVKSLLGRIGLTRS